MYFSLPLLDGVVECQVEKDPFQCGGGGFSSRRQEVRHDAGQILDVERTVVLHLGQVDVYEVSRVGYIQTLLVLGNLGSKELFLFSYNLLPPAVTGPSRKELQSGGQNSWTELRLLLTFRIGKGM